MDYLRRKQKVRGRLYGKTVRIILVIVLLLLIRPTWKIYQKSRESEANLKRAEQEQAALEQRKNELSRDLENIKTDQGRDEEIRSKLGVAKAGETVVVIVDDKKEPAAAEPVPQKTNTLSRAWSTVLSWFGVR